MMDFLEYGMVTNESFVILFLILAVSILLWRVTMLKDDRAEARSQVLKEKTLGDITFNKGMERFKNDATNGKDFVLLYNDVEVQDEELCQRNNLLMNIGHNRKHKAKDIKCTYFKREKEKAVNTTNEENDGTDEIDK